MVDSTWLDSIVFSPAHQNPSKAPATPMHSFEDSTLNFNNYTSTNSTSAFNTRNFGSRALQRRDALRCDDAPCVDGRYVFYNPFSLISHSHRLKSLLSIESLYL
jgi:hypothetical protein